jgi:Fe/S biogenesis protein NfuA
MIKISKNAQKYISRLLLKKENTHIKIFVKYFKKNATCHMKYISVDSVSFSDKKIKFNNFNVYINEKDLPYLKDSQIKLVKNNLNFELMLNSPNLKNFPKKNFNSFQEKVNYFIELYINSFLSSHGGKLILLEINDKNQAMVEFQGGCNGCSMINSTLKNMVEKRLLKNFPQLTKVIDLTDHKHDVHSYY